MRKKLQFCLRNKIIKTYIACQYFYTCDLDFKYLENN